MCAEMRSSREMGGPMFLGKRTLMVGIANERVASRTYRLEPPREVEHAVAERVGSTGYTGAAIAVAGAAIGTTTASRHRVGPLAARRHRRVLRGHLVVGAQVGRVGAGGRHGCRCGGGLDAAAGARMGWRRGDCALRARHGE
jgi:hypothetical protein